MGNILETLLPEHRVQMITEGCKYHNHRFITEDGICLKCEKLQMEEYYETN